jgi:hypothetical protein
MKACQVWAGCAHSGSRDCYGCGPVLGRWLVWQSLVTRLRAVRFGFRLWPATGRRLFVTRVWHVTACYVSSLPTTGPQWLTCFGLCLHIDSCQCERCGWYRNSGKIFEFSVQKYIKTRNISSWDKIFSDRCYCVLRNFVRLPWWWFRKGRKNPR